MGKYFARDSHLKTKSQIFPVRVDLTQSIRILLYDHRSFAFFLSSCGLHLSGLRAVHQTVSLKVTPFQNERIPPFIYGSKLNRSRYFTAEIFGVVPFHFKRKIYVTNVFSSINILNFMMIHNCSIIVICKILVFRIKMSEIEHRRDHMNS